MCMQEAGCRASAGLVPMSLPMCLPNPSKPVRVLGVRRLSDLDHLIPDLGARSMRLYYVNG